MTAEGDRGYALNEEVAAAKVIGGEAVIINLATGRYYSLEGLAGWAWEQMQAGATTGRIAEAIKGAYGLDDGRAAADLEALVGRLREENLVIPRVDGTEGGVGGAPPEGDYAAPELDVFTDMEELLAFDPPFPSATAADWEQGEPSG